MHNTQPAHSHLHDYKGHVEAVEAHLEYWRTKRLELSVLQLHRRGVLTLYDLIDAAARLLACLRRRGPARRRGPHPRGGGAIDNLPSDPNA
jgi:hypothetical protein